MNIICFLTVRPIKSFLNFCDSLSTNYNVYVCVDDNTYNVPKTNYSTIIQIDNKIAENNGFNNILGYYGKFPKKWYNKATARDKALFYFYFYDIQYKYIWFIEEDVFIPKIDTLINIDLKYTKEDLLCKENLIYNNYKDTINNNGKFNWHHWNYVFNDSNLMFPFARSMICCIRCSKLLIKLIGEHAIKYRKLFVDECIFNTITLHNHLLIKTPKEFKNIHYKKKINGRNSDWSNVDIIKFNSNCLYHPFKNIPKHHDFRKKII